MRHAWSRMECGEDVVWAARPSGERAGRSVHPQQTDDAVAERTPETHEVGPGWEVSPRVVTPVPFERCRAGGQVAAHQGAPQAPLEIEHHRLGSHRRPSWWADEPQLDARSSVHGIG